MQFSFQSGAQARIEIKKVSWPDRWLDRIASIDLAGGWWGEIINQGLFNQQSRTRAKYTQTTRRVRRALNIVASSRVATCQLAVDDHDGT